MYYKASLGKIATIITIGCILLFAGLVIDSIIESEGETNILIVASLFITILMFAYLFAPKGYTLCETELIINRPIGKVHVKLETISNVERIKEFEGSTIRTFADGGLFGFYGKFYNTKIGKMTLYVTRSDTEILIKTKDNRNIVISPNDIGLLEALRLKIHKS